MVSDCYVDHVLSANLDSTNAFEGPEKLLELWFWSSANACPDAAGLRRVPLDQWIRILDLVNCKILLLKSGPAMDAYLLSELSLFVFPHKLILKTCGTTTTLACFDVLFDIVSSVVGRNITSFDTFKVFYSRRLFMFPEKQTHVHRDWKNEVLLLNNYFHGGKSYVVGDFTSDDHWYLYMAGSGGPDRMHKEQDQTFEMLMTNLDPQCAQAFVTDRHPGQESVTVHSSDEEEHDLGHDLGLDIMKDSGLDNVFAPGDHEAVRGGQMPSPLISENMELSDEEIKDEPLRFAHDAFAFSPCGYSSNSVSTKKDYYYTLHITPEHGWLYASFETNYPFSATSSVGIVDVVRRVLRIFRPGRLSITLMNESDGACTSALGVAYHESFAQLAKCDSALAKMGYRKQEKVIYDLKGEYSLLYLHFDRA